MDPKSRLIFLDVGAHIGETLSEITHTAYSFDHIHSFEPDLDCVSQIDARYAADIAAGKLTVHAFGLSDRTGEATLYGDNSGGSASEFSAKTDVDAHRQKLVRLVRASDFFDANLLPTDRVIMKLNCEGSECRILTDLIETGRIWRVTNVMIDFDLFKVPGRRHEPFQVLRRLSAIGFDRYALAKTAMVGRTHQQRIRNWLSQVDCDRPLTASPELFAGLPRYRNPGKLALWTLKRRMLGLLDGMRAEALERRG